MTDADLPDLVLRYAEHPDGIIDTYLPASTPAPLVVVVHGGYWRARYDRTYLRSFARALADHGYAVALPEFRRVGAGGEWPVIGRDVAAALAAVRTSLPTGVITPEAPYRLVGHSAGGHLAMWAGLRAGPVDCAAVITVAPVSDLRHAYELHLSNDAVAELLGGSPDQVPDACADADPLAALPSAVPVTIIHGDADEDVPIELNRAVAERHPEIDYIELPGVDHFVPLDPDSSVFLEVLLPALGR